MPSAPNTNTSFDEIRTTDGAVCRSSNGGNFIIHGGVSDANSDFNNHYYGRGIDDEQGIYVGFAYSFGGGERIDCSRLAKIEFEKAELELQKLRAEIEALEQLKNLQAMQLNGELPPLSYEH
ncbi:hypothetical protein HGP28_16095 [Vibrio sp. SM6]|uniref:Uncharacterized protein n=2 Tax=Vibrio agarilyticus TaxID=2726741 RepID=A0A7X8TTS9_9VIBR|nr:hypothetical protein [Vibrio agarilyticus]